MKSRTLKRAGLQPVKASNEGSDGAGSLGLLMDVYFIKVESVLLKTLKNDVNFVLNSRIKKILNICNEDIFRSFYCLVFEK